MKSAEALLKLFLELVQTQGQYLMKADLKVKDLDKKIQLFPVFQSYFRQSQPFLIVMVIINYCLHFIFILLSKADYRHFIQVFSRYFTGFGRPMSHPHFHYFENFNLQFFLNLFDLMQSLNQCLVFIFFSFNFINYSND